MYTVYNPSKIIVVLWKYVNLTNARSSFFFFFFCDINLYMLGEIGCPIGDDFVVEMVLMFSKYFF